MPEIAFSSIPIFVIRKDFDNLNKVINSLSQKSHVLSNDECASLQMGFTYAEEFNTESLSILNGFERHLRYKNRIGNETQFKYRMFSSSSNMIKQIDTNPPGGPKIS